MKNKIFIRVLFLFLVITKIMVAQPVSSKWIVPPYQFDFNNGLLQQELPHLYSPGPNIYDKEYYYQGQSANFASNAMYTASGKLLFYVVDNMVYDPEGYAIAKLSLGDATQDESENTTGYSEISIVPVPGSCSKYYIITALMEGGNQTNLTFCYATIDLLAPNIIHTGRFGAIPLIGNPADLINCKKAMNFIIGDEFHYGSNPQLICNMAISTALPNGERFAFFSCPTAIFRCKITSTGISLDASPASAIGKLNMSVLVSGSNTDELRTESEIKHIGVGGVEWKYAVTFNRLNNVGGDNLSPFIYVASLDANGFVIAGTEKICEIPQVNVLFLHLRSQAKGLEFSEDGNFLYTSVHNAIGQPTTNFNPIGYYDLSGTTSNLSFNPLVFTGDDSFQWSQIEMGMDNKLYMTNGDAFATLSNSNNPLNNNWVVGNNFPSVAGVITPNYGMFTPDPLYPIFYDNTLKLYTLPDQIDQENYSNIFELPTTECCVINTTFEKDFLGSLDVEISSNQLALDFAAYDRKFDGTVTIYPGITVTLINKTWEFGANGKIVVKQGGRLMLNNSILKAIDCDAIMWRGVELLGNPSMVQINPNQGFLYMYNHSLITRAITGVAAVSGGWVVSRTGQFIDNATDVYLANYRSGTSSNQSQFYQTSFISEKPLPAPFILREHVFLIEVNKVAFSQCTFSCRYYPTKAAEYGIGINTWSAAFSVVGHCTVPGGCDVDNMLPTAFNRLYKGIVARKFVKNNVYTVDRCFFNNCLTGIENNGVDFATIIRSKFELGNFPIKGDNFGINLQRGTAFTIEENRFKQTNNYGKKFTGILAFDNTPVGLDNEIYNNAFYNMMYANMSNYTNRSDDPISQNPLFGLQYFCNYNENTSFGLYDFAVRGDAHGQNQGIRLYQGGNSTGGPGGAAGNIFSHRDVTINESDFYQNTNEVGSVVYYQYAPNGVVDPAQECIDFSSNITPTPTTSPQEDGCRAKYGTSPLRMLTGGELENLALEYESLAAAKGITVNNLHSLMDAGNTFQLLTHVDNSGQNTANALKNQLLNTSPFLSDTVLKEASDKTWVLNNYTVMQLFFANPDAARKKAMVEFLATKTDPMATWMIDAIKENATAASARTSLESTIAAYSSKQSEIVRNVISSFLMDTLAVDSAQFYTWVNKLNSPTSDYILAENLIQNGQEVLANSILNELPVKYNLSSVEIEKHNAMLAIYNLHQNLTASNRVASQLNFAELENIQNIANGDRCLAKTIANNILELNGVTPVIEEVLYPADESNQRRGNAGGNLVNGGKVNEISIYPNPANDFFQISLPEDNYIITVYNSTGQIVNVQASNTQAKMIIRTINYAEGLYLIKVEKDNFQQKIKVTIKH